jgi:DNA-binding transcriptional ArsR family regulator
MQVDRRSGDVGGKWRHRARYLHKQMCMCLSCLVSPQTRGFEAAGELLKVLAAPARLAIVTELAEQPRFVHELVARLGMSQPLVSQHLRVLRGARLVGVERRGREAVYSLADQHVAHIVADAVQHSKEDR